jgi:hypothetical protein
MNRRWNRQAAALLQAGAGRKDPQAVKRLLGLFEEEKALVQNMVSASQRQRYRRLGGIARSLLAVAKSENSVLASLGAHDCTLSVEAFEL